MLRRLQTVSGKNIDVQMKADVAMKRGMVVQKNFTNTEAVMPASQAGLYFVDRDVQPTGLMAYEGEISDYDTRLETIAVGDFVQLEKPVVGERYATDQYVADNLVVGGYMDVSTAADATLGKLIHSADASKFMYCGTMSDNGHTLAIVEIVE